MVTLYIMIFIYNAILIGWTVEKNRNNFTFHMNNIQKNYTYNEILELNDFFDNRNIVSYSDISPALIYKIIFIYNAIQDNWIVEKGSRSDIIFTKDSRYVVATSRDFIRNNLSVPEDL